MERQLTSGSWRSQGGQSSSRYGNTYGRSSLPVTERRPVGQRQASTSVSKPAITSSPQPVSRPQTVSRRVPDAEFEPTPILQLRPGDRIEHNRFGLGRIVEISGEVVDLKAKIQFDDHGEKILILKYAKIRKV